MNKTITIIVSIIVLLIIVFSIIYIVKNSQEKTYNEVSKQSNEIMDNLKNINNAEPAGNDVSIKEEGEEKR